MLKIALDALQYDLVTPRESDDQTTPLFASAIAGLRTRQVGADLADAYAEKDQVIVETRHR